MMRQIDHRAGTRLIILMSWVALATGVPAWGQTRADPNQQQVSLVRQDFSDCSNSNVSDQDPSRLGGTVWVTRGADGITRVKVAMTVKPNTSYHFFLKCVRLLGDIKTYDEGEGNAEFEFPTNSVGNAYAFDMYPEGAPPGNKYQSVQVRFQ
jgi:hypothetical protein